MPSPFEALLLALAAWRTWHLIAEDDITQPLRDRYVTRKWVKELVECPFCLGFWVSLAWAGAFALWPDGTPWAALPFALNAVVVAVNHWLTAD